MQSENLDKLLPALAKFQATIKPIVKNDKNPHFNHDFANLEGIITVIQPVLTDCDLIINCTMSVLSDGSSGLVTTLWHISGQFIRGEMPLLLAKEDPQGQGSGITYARRYAISAMLNLVQADDDGQRATESRVLHQPQSKSNTPKAASPAASIPPCPECGNVTSTMKSLHSEGFYCNPKRGGCSAKFDPIVATTNPAKEVLGGEDISMVDMAAMLAEEEHPF